MMDYFDTIEYNGLHIRNISQKIIIESIKSFKVKSIFFEYMIKGWKAPEELAYDFYGSCNEMWVILALNDIVNPYTDWLLKDNELKLYAMSKYGNKLNTIHHYTKDGVNYNYPIVGSIPVTNYEIEQELNESKRIVKILYPALLPELKSQIKSKFRK